ncbi:hypothetical protein EVG20_g4279 [Dentipellis fragilis]|uniref:HNH nuclease domain-containing protein n=1 Tax=Dentipellis fragilis TaxID=205917 RepID=A0A4Y9YYX2_9AGAM|nr:hypothetical protein EVG20_g4279 [Dentipellis fragilis]
MNSEPSSIFLHPPMMSTPTKVIHVSTQLPTDGNPSNLDLDNWVWKRCLTFPVDALLALKFSNKPYKWIRYATGVVLGAEGTLSRQDDESLDLEPDLDSLNHLPDVTDLCYRVEVSNEEGRSTRRIFPLDPDFAASRITGTSTADAPCCADFRAEVSRRDGDSCVATGLPSEVCDAVHLVAHCKGDDYIEDIIRHRQQGTEDVIEEIDDERNGLFLNKCLHAVLGKGFAILKTPNFAMVTKDVIQAGTETVGTTRYTAHLFNVNYLGSEVSGLLLGGPSGSAIRVPARDEDMASWPPDVLFDAVYASAVSRHFGGPMKDLRECLEPFQRLYYPVEGPMSKEEAERKQSAEKRHAKRSDAAPEEMDNMDTVFYLWHVSAGISADMLARRREEEAAKRREASVAKVESWRDSVPT